MRSQRGFTLIEVLITMTILATLTVFTTQAIQQAIKSKIKITDQIDEVSKVRDALRIIEKDINLAYHYRDLELEIQELLKKKRQKPGAPVAGGVNPPGGIDTSAGGGAEGSPEDSAVKREVERFDPTTYFLGLGEKINFVTMNAGRLLRDTRQADFVEVGYELKSCKNLTTGQNSSCLWRRLSPIADDAVDKGGDEIVLLENVEEFKLRYLGAGKQDWVNDWKSDQGGDAVTQNRFPNAVEINLTTAQGEGDKKKKISMQIVASVRFPNNPPSKEAPAAAGTPQGQ